MTAILVALVIIVVLAVAVAGASIRVLREYERAVVFRLGRLVGQKGPGIVILIPIIDRMVRVDLRTVTFEVPPQEVITRDNVPAKVNAVAYFRVVDPVKSVVEVERIRNATSQIAQTTLRSVLGRADLDTLLAEREQLNESLQQITHEPRKYGFHGTLKAPFPLAGDSTEAELIVACEAFAATARTIPVIEPVVRAISGDSPLARG